MRRFLSSLGLLAACGPNPAVLVQRGLALELAPSPPPDARWQAADLHERACQAGHGAGCFHFEGLMGALPPTAARYQREAPGFEAGCEAGDARACFRLGLLHDDDRGFAAVESMRALGLFRRACEGGYAYACQRAALLSMVLGLPTEKIAVVETRALCETSCQGGYGRACVVLADLVKAGRGGPRDERRSRELLRQACVRGQPDACLRLAKRTRWLAGPDRPAQLAARRDLEPLVSGLAPSCEAGHLEACNVGRVLLTWDRDLFPPDTIARWDAWAGRARDPVGFFEERPAGDTSFWQAYWDERCAQGSAEACVRLAASLDEGSQGGGARVAALRGRAAALRRQRLRERVSTWERECSQGVAFGCLMLAEALREGWLAPPDPARAEEPERRGQQLVRALRRSWGLPE